MKISITIRAPRWLRPPTRWATRLAMVAGLLLVAGPVLATDRFSDVPTDNVHHDDISAIADAGITIGCNAEGTEYCPLTVVNRQQMGSFLARTAGLGGNPPVTNADELDGMDSTDFYAHGDAVPSGQTIRGAVGADFHAYDATQASDFGVDVTLPMPAPVGLTDDDVFVSVAFWQGTVGQTAPTTTDTNAGCTGTLDEPTAPAGKVCIYVTGADLAFNLNGYSVRFGTEGSRYGFKLKWDASTQGDTFVDAVWAYTAP